MSERGKCCLYRKGRSSVQNFHLKKKKRKKERKKGCLKKDKKERSDRAVLSPLSWALSLRDEGLQTFSLSEHRLRTTVAEKKESWRGEMWAILTPEWEIVNYLEPRRLVIGQAMAPHSSTLAWKIPWTEEPGRLQSMGSLRVGHDWATSLSLFTFMCWRRKWQPTPVFFPGESQGRGSLVTCRLWGCTESDTTEAT